MEEVNKAILSPTRVDEGGLIPRRFESTHTHKHKFIYVIV